MRFARGDMRGPHRFAQKRLRSSVAALRSIAAAESAKNQLLRDFRRRSIFDFCNNIGTKRTSWAGLMMSVERGRPEVLTGGQNDAIGPIRDIGMLKCYIVKSEEVCLPLTIRPSDEWKGMLWERSQPQLKPGIKRWSATVSKHGF
jgi:hypothetical protein